MLKIEICAHKSLPKQTSQSQRQDIHVSRWDHYVTGQRWRGYAENLKIQLFSKNSKAGGFHQDDNTGRSTVQFINTFQITI